MSTMHHAQGCSIRRMDANVSSHVLSSGSRCPSASTCLRLSCLCLPPALRHLVRKGKRKGPPVRHLLTYEHLQRRLVLSALALAVLDLGQPIFERIRPLPSSPSKRPSTFSSSEMVSCIPCGGDTSARSNLNSCYPHSKELVAAGPDYKPLSQELSKLVSFARSKPSQLTKIGEELESRISKEARGSTGGYAKSRA